MLFICFLSIFEFLLATKKYIVIKSVFPTENIEKS